MKRTKGPRGQGRGVIAIALFDIAGALGRLASSDEARVSLLQEANDLHLAANQAQESDATERQAIMQALADDVRASSSVKPGSAPLLEQYRYAAKRVVERHGQFAADSSHSPDCAVCALAVVVDADS